MTTVLLTGFEPFAGADSNSSWDAVELVAEAWDGPAELVIELLPVTFEGAGAAMAQLIERHDPDLVVATGLANGRSAVTPERIAVNLEDARIPDNAGDQPRDRTILASGPAAYWSGLPVRRIAEAIAAAGIPSAVSESAGTYVCNSVMYRLMDAVSASPRMAGFIHVPASPVLAAAGEPQLEVEEIARGLRIAIDISLASLVEQVARPSTRSSNGQT